MPYSDLTLITCSYNQPAHISAMFKSFVHLHGDGPFSAIVMENSINDEIRNLLDSFKIKYIKNPGGTHSKSIDTLLASCQTKYALLVDTDIIFLKKIDPILRAMEINDGTILGEIQGDRGGYRLYPRVAPWFCLINIEHIKRKKISFHDQARIDRTNSQYFYNAVPLNPHINNINPFYDVGATFYEDINRAQLRIIDAKGINTYFAHYEGGSWRRNSGNEGYVNLGNIVYKRFLSETAHLNNIDIKEKFISKIWIAPEVSVKENNPQPEQAKTIKHPERNIMTYSKPVIGMLLSKDDGDIIHDVMTEYNKYFDAIYCIDASSDNSLDIIKSFNKVKYAVSEKELGINGAMLKDGIRQLLLSRIQDEYGYEGWIFPIHTDEMFYGNPRNILPIADEQNAKVINCLVAHFVLHKTDIETENEPNIVNRKLWHFIGQCESCGFKNQQHIYYNLFEHMRVIPHGFIPYQVCNKVLLRRHYNQRTEDQLRARIKNRLETGWQPAYKELEKNLYVIDPKQIAGTGQIYSPIQKFDGEFKFNPNAEYWKRLIIS